MATTEHISAVAERIKLAHDSGLGIVVTVSAMGKQTDRLLRLAGEVSRDPSPREIDQLLSTGELQSVALLAMALHDRGVAATSLQSLRIKSRTCWALTESSAPVGSSANTNFGRFASARATATRCCWPSESFAGR